MSGGKAIVGERVCVDGVIKPAAIVVRDGKIEKICDRKAIQDQLSQLEVLDVGNDVIMPGVVDCHVHVNEPGRTAWEGYETATKAAAAGGVTTIVDMPLNSIPSTVTKAALLTKLDSAKDQCSVDVGFWGGIVPGNQEELVPMLQAGVVGFKCFLIHSGVDDFPSVTREDLEKAFPKLQGTDAVVLFHAEVDCNCTSSAKSEGSQKYNTFLETRPEEMEVEAIKLVCDMCLKYRVRCHIVHLSAASALPLIVAAKQQGAPLTVETTHHYLTLDAETIPEGATQFKCCPPIRSKSNQEELWRGLVDGHIDMVVSDHSPCTPDLKHLETGDFLTAWGGIASVQFGLPLFWTHAQRYGLDINDVIRLLCENTAKLASLSGKGRMGVGNDADFVVWRPDARFKVQTENIHHKNKVTPYLGHDLQGVVSMTILRGDVIYKNASFQCKPAGNLLLKSWDGTSRPSRL